MTNTIKKPRRKINEYIKKDILLNQDFKCANKPKSQLYGLVGYDCLLWQHPERQGKFDKSGYEFDHIIEHCISYDNSIDNLQALCSNCHSYKTNQFRAALLEKQSVADTKIISNIDNDKKTQPSIAIKLNIRNIGIDLPKSNEFINIKKFDDCIFDYLAIKNNEMYLFKLVARNKITNNGYNKNYNLINNSKGKCNNAIQSLKNKINNKFVHFCYLIVPIEIGYDCIYYWGELLDINSQYTVKNILNGLVEKTITIPVSEDKLKTYKIFGSHLWEYILANHLIK